VAKIEQFYISDEYVRKHPTMHVEHSAWKISLMRPYLQQVAGLIGSGKCRLLDVGGGAGLILKESAAIIGACGITVEKLALDLSPAMLAEQQRNNPDLVAVMQRDARETQLPDKSVDLTMMVDVLEHIPQPERALVEIARVSRYALFKVPVEDDLLFRLRNWITKGRPRQDMIEDTGHINFYTGRSLRTQVARHCGRIVGFSYSRKYAYFRKHPDPILSARLRRRMLVHAGNCLSAVSPSLASYIMGDYAMLLCECRKLG